MKCYGPVMSIFMLYDCIGTRFLGKTLEDVLAKHETKWSIDKFILIGTLLLIVYLDGYAGKERLLRQLRDVIADRQTKLIHLYLLLNLLEPLYGSPALSRVGQEDILPILADIHLAILGIRPGPQSAYGSQRSKLLSKLRVARSRAS